MARKFQAKGKIEMGQVVNDEASEFHNNPDKFFLAKCAFYMCNTCQKPFYGGLADCERDLALAEKTRKEDLVC